MEVVRTLHPAVEPFAEELKKRIAETFQIPDWLIGRSPEVMEAWFRRQYEATAHMRTQLEKIYTEYCRVEVRV